MEEKIQTYIIKEPIWPTFSRKYGYNVTCIGIDPSKWNWKFQIAYKSKVTKKKLFPGSFMTPEGRKPEDYPGCMLWKRVFVRIVPIREMRQVGTKKEITEPVFIKPYDLDEWEKREHHSQGEFDEHTQEEVYCE